MSGKYRIIVVDANTNVEQFSTDSDGYLVIYVDGGVAKATGKLEIDALTPTIAQIVLSRMAKR